MLPTTVEEVVALPKERSDDAELHQRQLLIVQSSFSQSWRSLIGVPPTCSANRANTSRPSGLTNELSKSIPMMSRHRANQPSGEPTSRMFGILIPRQ